MGEDVKQNGPSGIDVQEPVEKSGPSGNEELAPLTREAPPPPGSGLRRYGPIRRPTHHHGRPVPVMMTSIAWSQMLGGYVIVLPMPAEGDRVYRLEAQDEYENGVAVNPVEVRVQEGDTASDPFAIAAGLGWVEVSAQPDVGAPFSDWVNT